MKKFLFWQFGTLCILMLVYTVYISLGADQSRAVFYSMVGVGIGTVVIFIISGVRVRPTLDLRSELQTGSTLLAATVIATLSLWIADICGASLAGDFITFALLFMLTVAIPVEMAVTVVALIIVFSVAFGALIPASFVILALAIFWGIALKSQGLVIRKEFLFLSSSIQAILAYLIFTHDPLLYLFKFLN